MDFYPVEMPKKLLPLASMERVLKHCGAERVADNAKEALKEAVEDKAEEIAKRAIRYAMHAGRKTVKADDVKLAAQAR